MNATVGDDCSSERQPLPEERWTPRSANQNQTPSTTKAASKRTGASVREARHHENDASTFFSRLKSMSRLSRIPRESIFTGGQQAVKAIEVETCSLNLIDCVQNINDVLAETHDAQLLLRNGTYDLSRIRRVLDNQRVFLFVNEFTVDKYKQDLTEEIEPQIIELIERAKKGMKALERKKLSLQNKADRTPAANATAHRSAAARLEARRMQLATEQRKGLERELQVLQEEIESLEKSYDV